MDELLGLLDAKRSQVSDVVEGLRKEIAALSEQLVVEEEALAKLEVTVQTVAMVLAEQPATAEMAAPRAVAGAVQGDGRPVKAVVPHRADDVVLPGMYQQIVEVVRTTGTSGLRAVGVCTALDTGVLPKHVEGMRGKLKRLVDRGWLTEVEPGVFVWAGAAGGSGSVSG